MARPVKTSREVTLVQTPRQAWAFPDVTSAGACADAWVRQMGGVPAGSLKFLFERFEHAWVVEVRGALGHVGWLG